MAFMVGEAGRVVGIEHIPELVTMATRNIQNDNPQLLISERIKLIGKDHIPILILQKLQLNLYKKL